MTEYIDAPMPFIIGIKRSIWKKIHGDKRKADYIEKDIAIIDLDKGILKCDFSKLPSFPPKILEIAYTELISILDINYENNDNSQTENENDDIWLKKTVQIKQIILKFILSLLGNFRKFYLDIACSPKQYDSPKSPPNPTYFYAFDAYIANMNHDSRCFMKEFVRSQAFMLFIEKMRCPSEQAQTPDFVQFNQLVNSVNSKGEKSVHNMLKIFTENLFDSLKSNVLTFLLDGCRSLYERVLSKNLCSQQNFKIPGKQIINIQKIVKMPGINFMRETGHNVKKNLHGHNSPKFSINLNSKTILQKSSTAANTPRTPRRIFIRN